MIKKIIITIIIILAILNTSVIHANEWISNSSKIIFNILSKKISTAKSSKNQILYFEWLSEKLSDLITKKKLSENQLILIDDLIKLSNEYVFDTEINEKEKNNKLILWSNSLLKTFKLYSYNPDHIFLENWVWYTYSFDEHLKFPEWTIIRSEDFDLNWIKPDTSIVFLKEANTLWFIIDYKKVKLISNSIIYWIPNKYNFLREIKDDKKKLNYETDEQFKKLKGNALKLTSWKTKELKIKAIYNYVLDNIEYPKTFSLSDSKIFSWIDTFKNKNWVCEWYTKVFLYMLNFANINNAEIIRWYVLDSVDFPKVWHAWVKIWDHYYDPTFDDPIWIIKTKNFEQYKFYSLPSDLFYTNRYDFDKLPEYIKKEDITFRKNFITQQIIPLIPKYENSWYNLLKPYILKLAKWIKADKKLDIEDLKNMIEYHEIDWLTFIKNWVTKSILNIKYYVINESQIDEMLEQLDYKLDWYYLFKWKLDDWSYEYRLAYNVVFE